MPAYIDTDRDTIRFSSGRSAYTHRGIVGIDQNLSLFEGYDGSIDWPTQDWKPAASGDLTAADMRELADLMIETWCRFRASMPA